MIAFPFTCAWRVLRHNPIGWVMAILVGLTIGLAIPAVIAWENAYTQALYTWVLSVDVLTFPEAPGQHTLVMSYESSASDKCSKHSADVMGMKLANGKTIVVDLNASMNGGELGSMGRMGDVNRYELWTVLPYGLPSGTYKYEHRVKFECRVWFYEFDRFSKTAPIDVVVP